VKIICTLDLRLSATAVLGIINQGKIVYSNATVLVYIYIPLKCDNLVASFIFRMVYVLEDQKHYLY